ncbi:uncharacterized protein K452DRAFT_144737 [Aplosporella prunicola CBS 121167]|uniref:Tr-type G domain-containing protein n=1 Tax=Aplosporella prunicola CBS 121167 TaxID=1176127 RepID=A0A6A6BMY8_9PEZI|nr:uncharacterized protein K452DRAFT_144737 [Aplosporella prunicola CBS 121167]KAF2144624.1 hypothetical protein K452DRAFT_144737 [Aplosporella prunicola CBS 121167]
MASIFTFDPDPPRVASPWSTPRPHRIAGGLEPQAVLETDSSVIKLEAEPQEGPTEYKLHLLLRSRRSFNFTSTARHVAGSHRSSAGTPTQRTVSENNLSRTPPKASSSQSRQHRLEQLTTQLLWRLQQSSPYHSTAANELVIPQLPEAALQLKAPPSLSKVLPGLEESKGALYEIGIADDGTFVGLAEDEMDESLTNLRAMAASLGCTVNVLRMVAVGDCAWHDEVGEKAHHEKLWVSEAFVKPDVSAARTSEEAEGITRLTHSLARVDLAEAQPTSEQLRVSLTGATMSGKSSLLGSLSTATLDNGRGKSRLSLLRHRHEIASGMTSSVTQELLGYNRSADGSGDVDVINYASGNIDSWTDIHAACNSGRLVFLSDSAGHPRYRRTTVRGLMGWAPHWTLLCMPADNAEDTSGKVGSTPSSGEVLGDHAADVDLSEAYLELCLKLGLPLVIVVTKMDLASKTGLRATLSKLLSILKAAGKKPDILSEAGSMTVAPDLGVLSASDLADARRFADQLREDPLAIVPIVLTSAVKGTGIRKLHALLHELQIPPVEAAPPAPNSLAPPNSSQETSPLSALYHVEDVYRFKAAASSESSETSIISGHLHYGTLHLGDELTLGPFPVDAPADDSDSGSGNQSTATTIHTSRSFPGALQRLTLPYHPASSSSRTHNHSEWRKVRITSIRNLRLPVRTLHAGQVGTLGLVPVDEDAAAEPAPALSRIRKGMVLARGKPTSYRAFVARFPGDAVRGLIVGSLAVVYIASVRASAKVIAIAVDDEKAEVGPSAGRRAGNGAGVDDDDGFGFAFEDSDSDADGATAESTLVTFQFVATRECVDVGARVLVMEGGRGRGADRASAEKSAVGLEGFAGCVIEGFG